MTPTNSHSSPRPPKTSRWVVFATVLTALLTTGSAFAYMLTQERPPNANSGYSSTALTTDSATHQTP